MEGNIVQNTIPTKERRHYGRPLLITAIALTLGYLHSHYVAILFENDRNFSMLSTLEREMSFKSEMGFYYSYYKTIVEEEPFLSAVNKLIHDKLVEYPKEINAFNRFNIHPEVLVGSFYRYLKPWLNHTLSCVWVHRGEKLEPVESCTGLAEPMHFYVNAVWVMAGLTVSFLFLFGTFLSHNILGGLFTVCMYMVNHRHSTRVMWAPAQREAWAQPALLLQMCLITRLVRQPVSKLPTLMAIFLLNCFCLLFWQFTQFIFLTQLFIMYVMVQLRIIDLQTLFFMLHAHFCGLQMAVILLQGNEMLRSSLYVSFFIVLSLYCLLFSWIQKKIETPLDLIIEAVLVFLRVGAISAFAVWMKNFNEKFWEIEEDTVIWEMLLSKFADYKTFHTMLYTCSEVFDFLPTKTWRELWDSTLLPITLLCIVNSCLKWILATKNIIKTAKEDETNQGSDSDGDDSGIENASDKKRTKPKCNKAAKNDLNERTKRRKSKDKPKKEITITFMEYANNLCIDPGVFYNMSQMVVFGVMTTLVMRLKLLFVPHMCLFSSLIMNEYFESMKFFRPIIRRTLRYGFYSALLLTVATKMLQTIEIETSHYSEFSDPHQEELLNWISSTTSQNAVFAGPMPLMSSVMLSTRRAIANHPHYENVDARHRNYAVYKTYGKFFPHKLYQDLTAMQVTHLVLDMHYCYGKSNRGCTFEQIWDVEKPELRDHPRLCDLLLHHHLDHFYTVFENPRYTVFRVHDYSVRYSPRTFHT